MGGSANLVAAPGPLFVAGHGAPAPLLEPARGLFLREQNHLDTPRVRADAGDDGDFVRLEKSTDLVEPNELVPPVTRLVPLATGSPASPKVVKLLSSFQWRH